MPAWVDALRVGDGPLLWASLAILWLAVAYLFALGIVVLSRPAVARRFLSAFAQTTRANLAEGGLRFVAGLAFVGAASRTKDPSFSIGLGFFLSVTAILLALLPGIHRRIAAKSTARLFIFFRAFGVASLVLAAALLWFIT